MEYVLKSSALLFLFFIGYRVFLIKETFFSSNRWFLLAGLVLSFSLPLVVIPVYETQIIQVPALEATNSFTQPGIKDTSNNLLSPAADSFSWDSLLLNLYWLGVIVFALRFCMQLVSVFLIIKSGNRKPFDNYTIFETQKNISPFSFFKAIIYNPFQLSNTAIDQILTHEKVHVADWHSIDIILSEIALVFMWFNPIIWWYRRHLIQNLEFIADAHSIEQVPCPKTYQTVLLDQSLSNHQLAITNNFHSSFIKKRIIMLNKSKSKPFQRLKMVYIIPFLALFLFNFSTERHTRYLSEDIPPVHEVVALQNQQVISNTIEVLFTKETTKESLEKIKKFLKAEGVTMNILEIQRGENNYITKIAVEFKTKNGSANYNVANPKGIDAFYFEMKNDGSFGVGAVKNSKGKIGEKVSIKGDRHSQGTAGNVWIEEDGDEIQIIELDSADQVRYEVIRGNGTIYTKMKDSIWIEKKVKNNFKFKSATDSINGFVFVTDSVPAHNFMHKRDVDVDFDFNDPGNEFIFINGSNNASLLDGDREVTVIVDGKTVSVDKLGGINPNDIHAMHVIKEKDSEVLYGTSAKDGAIIVTTKNAWVRKDATKDHKIATIGYFEAPPSLYKIDKRSTGIELDKLKEKLESQGIDVKYSKIKRNELGEIIRIKISLKNNSGDASSASYKSDDGIDTIYFGVQNGSLIVSSNPPK